MKSYAPLMHRQKTITIENPELQLTVYLHVFITYNRMWKTALPFLLSVYLVDVSPLILGSAPVSSPSFLPHVLIYPKTLDRRPCTGRSREAVVIFLFGLEVILIRHFRVLLCAVCSSPKLQATIGYYSDQTQFLLAPKAIRPVSNPILSTYGPWENTPLLKCRRPHCVALSFYIMSL